jgi:hypothetical protein
MLQHAFDPGALRRDERALSERAAPASSASSSRPGCDGQDLRTVDGENGTPGIAAAGTDAGFAGIFDPQENGRKGCAHLQRCAAQNAAAGAVALPSEAIADNPHRLPDRNFAALVQSGRRKPRVERGFGANERKVNRDRPFRWRVRSEAGMDGYRLDFDDYWTSRSVAIMNAHILDRCGAMSGCQHGLRRHDNSSAKTRVAGAAFEHHYDMGRKALILESRPDQSERRPMRRESPSTDEKPEKNLESCGLFHRKIAPFRFTKSSVSPRAAPNARAASLATRFLISLRPSTRIKTS